MIERNIYYGFVNSDEALKDWEQQRLFHHVELDYLTLAHCHLPFAGHQVRPYVHIEVPEIAVPNHQLK